MPDVVQRLRSQIAEMRHDKRRPPVAIILTASEWEAASSAVSAAEIGDLQVFVTKRRLGDQMVTSATGLQAAKATRILMKPVAWPTNAAVSNRE